MHYLKHILIDLESEGIDYNDLSEEELYNVIVDTANDYLEDFADEWYDWKQENSGRWIDEYPNSCVTGKYQKDKLIDMINYVSQIAVNDIMSYFKAIEEIDGFITKSDDSITIKFDRDKITEICAKSDVNDIMTFYPLYKISKILSGYITFDSVLINKIEGTPFLSEDLMKSILDNPERYAIALIDTHF